ncbi:MAG: hypothetical protein IPL95_16055 [Saprospiraceae bacterium]|nr:hypothetical protein [Saprospiraceae bacterium]
MEDYFVIHSNGLRLKLALIYGAVLNHTLKRKGFLRELVLEPAEKNRKSRF